jgi:hypothetical protein
MPIAPSVVVASLFVLVFMAWIPQAPESASERCAFPKT